MSGRHLNPRILLTATRDELDAWSAAAERSGQSRAAWAKAVLNREVERNSSPEDGLKSLLDPNNIKAWQLARGVADSDVALTLRRIWSRVDHSVGPCPWTWTGTKIKGYGQASVNGKRDMAHRIIFELFSRPLAAGELTLHSCDNGHLGCVTPAHLRAGSHSDNMRDMVERGRSRKKRT